MPASPFPSSVHTLVVGAGFAGIAAAIAVRRANPSADVLLIDAHIRALTAGCPGRRRANFGTSCDNS
ncbi:MAG TPA: NAD(P)-binding protein [Mycobacterium sp.]|jgi:succinate dehydrogenase/fumarate reductase flavoprotein subunit